MEQPSDRELSAGADHLGSANAVTLATYAQAMQRWRDATCDVVADSHRLFLEEVLAVAPPRASVLEIGSGTGRDAAWMEERGLRVSRTDGCLAFVEALRERGVEAEPLNVLTDPVPSGFDLVYANAVLLHIEAADLPAVLVKLAGAAPLLAFTLKVGVGSEWSTAKTGLPRFFQYWSAQALRDLLAASPWDVEVLEQRRGVRDDCLQVICRRA